MVHWLVIAWRFVGLAAIDVLQKWQNIVTLNAGTEKRRYTMWRVRRYDPESLRLFMSNMGWDCLCLSPFGTKDGPTALMLLRKRSEPLM